MEVVVTLTARQHDLLRSAGALLGAPCDPAAFLADTAAGLAPDAPGAAPPARRPRSLPDGATVVVQGQAAAVELRRGAELDVVQMDGGQCADVLAWDAGHPRIRLSAAATRVRHGVSPGRGARLRSGWPEERELVEIVEDTAPGHDLLHPACAPGEYAAVGAPGAPSCAAVQAEAAVALGLEPGDLHDPLNLWFRPTVAEDGAVGWRPTPSHAGDRVTLRALADVLLLVNPCVDDVFGCSCRPLGAIALVSADGIAPRVSGAPVATLEVPVSLADGSRTAPPLGALRRAAVERALGILADASRSAEAPA